MKPKTPSFENNPSHSRTGSVDHGHGRRLLESENPAGTRTIRRGSGRGSEDNPARRKAVIIWSMLLIAMTLAVLVASVAVWLRPHLTHGATGKSSGLPDSQLTAVRVASKFPSPSREQSLELVKRALAIRDAEQVERIIRAGGASLGEIVDFFKSAEERDGPVGRLDWLSSVDVNGMLLEGVAVTYKGKEHPVQRLAFLTPDAAGNWKFDFDAFARPARPSWTDLLENHAQRSVVRVFIAENSYYNGPYGDDKVWHCFGMSSPDLEGILYGYCKMGSPEDAAMEVLFSDGRKATRATLEIRHTDGAEPHQFQIGSVLAEDWVLPDPIAVVN